MVRAGKVANGGRAQTQERFEAMLKVADSVDPRFGLALVLANETRHRIGSIRQLRWSDVNLKEKRITWRAENDKRGKQHVNSTLRRCSRSAGDGAQEKPLPLVRLGSSLLRATLIVLRASQSRIEALGEGLVGAR